MFACHPCDQFSTLYILDFYFLHYTCSLSGVSCPLGVRLFPQHFFVVSCQVMALSCAFVTWESRASFPACVLAADEPPLSSLCPSCEYFYQDVKCFLAGMFFGAAFLSVSGGISQNAASIVHIWQLIFLVPTCWIQRSHHQLICGYFSVQSS